MQRATLHSTGSGMGRFGRAVVLGVLLIAAPAAGDCSDSLAADAPKDRRTLASFLAVGDFGQPPRAVSLFEARTSVADAMDESHRCRRSDGLLLLGDNFYPHGLTPENFEGRVRDTVVAPFCRFLSLAGPHGASLASSCAVDASSRNPVPIVAVMGNHDYEPPIDGRLEKQELPKWIPEWRMPRGVAEVFEMPGGISLIAIDSVRLHEGAAFDAVAEALRSSDGPWRVLLAHHPLTMGGASWERRYVDELARVINESGHIVHLMLSGHEHYLATSRTAWPVLPLQAVIGSGAEVRPASHELVGEARLWLEPGFARIDLVEGLEGTSELWIALFATPSMPAEFWVRTRPVTRLGVTIDGTVREFIP